MFELNHYLLHNLFSEHGNRDRDRDRHRDRHRDDRSAMEAHPSQDNEEEEIPLITLRAGPLIILEYWGKNE